MDHLIFAYLAPHQGGNVRALIKSLTSRAKKRPRFADSGLSRTAASVFRITHRLLQGGFEVENLTHLSVAHIRNRMGIRPFLVSSCRPTQIYPVAAQLDPMRQEREVDLPPE